MGKLADNKFHQMKEIVLAGGCFWGIEAYLSRIPGAKETKVGYANGHAENPTYEEVCTSETGHTEACYVAFDEKIIDLESLLNDFWKVIDPTTRNRQGPDIGSQYRTGIYYIKEADLEVILKTKEQQQKRYARPIVTEIEPLTCFYPAEEYHQKYLEKNPRGYCHIDLNSL
ncbi:Peptide methionine sulfoxide reductase MsrA [Clostridium formicaceticum]|uniref:Peptide methionine sulfoxide reductase MsrA n=2 Tax=Clostridium formicaceticum TaxID=1497 RepID=A0AAC9RLH6_9CLOT|nr:Peptide methionine sulfoxide reductase MsrA [Clostridium formicaceticum]